MYSFAPDLLHWHRDSQPEHHRHLEQDHSVLLVVEGLGCAVCCGRLSCIPYLYPLEAYSNSFFQVGLQLLPTVLWGIESPWLRTMTWPSIFEIHPGWCIILWLNGLPLYGYISIFISKHMMKGLWVVCIVIKAAISIVIQIFLWMYVYFSFG